MRAGRRMAAVMVTVALLLGVVPAADAATDKTKIYITSVFELFLGRPATNTEVALWRSTVNAGQREVLTSTLATSDEWAGAEVNKLYLKILRRPADTAGRAYWVQTIKTGNRLEDIAAYFYGGDEYFARVGSTNTRFVDNLYLDLLGRSADSSGRNYWRARIVTGMTRSEVASNFYVSIESRVSRVRSLYKTILGRGPDSAGEAYWAEQLKTIGDVKLAAFLAASQEYFTRATTPTTTTTSTTTTTPPTTPSTTTTPPTTTTTTTPPTTSTTTPTTTTTTTPPTTSTTTPTTTTTTSTTPPTTTTSTTTPPSTTSTSTVPTVSVSVFDKRGVTDGTNYVWETNYVEPVNDLTPYTHEQADMTITVFDKASDLKVLMQLCAWQKGSDGTYSGPGNDETCSPLRALSSTGTFNHTLTRPDQWWAKSGSGNFDWSKGADRVGIIIKDGSYSTQPPLLMYQNCGTVCHPLGQTYVAQHTPIDFRATVTFHD